MNRVIAIFEAIPAPNFSDFCEGCCFSINESCARPSSSDFPCEPQFRDDYESIVWVFKGVKNERV